jgi:hypothetical protein
MVEISYDSADCCDSDLVNYYTCPNCEKEFIVESCADVVFYRDNRSYCPCCGIKLLWGCLL